MCASGFLISRQPLQWAQIDKDSPMQPPTPSSSRERQILTVTQLNRAAKDLLETYLPLLWVEGEVSNLATPSSGHWYFTLKDATGQVRCAMFKNRNMTVRFRPKPGDKVVVRGKVSLYEGRGDYQLIAEHMEPAGFGDLQRQFEALKNKLQAEGLFAAEHKQALPAWPSQLGIITSATGAAVHDILHVLQRRFPALPVTVIPVAVQGAEAAGQIARAVALANEQQLCDVLIVGRGGGSIEDLWAFNEEVVARAIHASRIPVVSAVGHEVDFTIADFVADVRAPTPSAAAEMVSPSQIELAEKLRQQEQCLVRFMQQQQRARRQKLEHLRARLQHPGQKLAAQAQALDQLELRMTRALQRQRQHAQQRLDNQCQRLRQVDPRKLLTQHQRTLQHQLQRLQSTGKVNLARHQQRLQQMAATLQSVSPLNTLNRGYAIVQSEAGDVICEAAAASVGQRVTARLKQGALHCQVVAKEPE